MGRMADTELSLQLEGRVLLWIDAIVCKGTVWVRQMRAREYHLIAIPLDQLRANDEGFGTAGTLCY